MSFREEILADGVRLILGDCREVLPTLGPVDAVVTDPPYGIGENSKKASTRGRSSALVKRAYPRDYGGSEQWDTEPCPPEILAWMRENSDWQIIFGGNYFELPPTSCWLIWDKLNTGDFADCELAWTNLPKAVRRIRWMWNGMLRRGGEERFHLTQKPLGVMQWCLQHLPPDVHVICDPFMGSGTTGVACVKKGLGFIGIERESHHFETACRRISDALAAPSFFIERPAPARQEALL
jgi:DNA modification methylase